MAHSKTWSLVLEKPWASGMQCVTTEKDRTARNDPKITRGYSATKMEAHDHNKHAQKWQTFIA